MAVATPKPALAAIVVAAFLAGCGGMGGMRDMHSPTRIEGSLAAMSVSEFYAANCAACHGTNRQGGVGPPLIPSRLTMSDEFYSETIANGRSGTSMPAWSQLGLSEANIASLVAFLRTEP
ncbi:MAG: cytochrome c [Dehalococcoidia bacterium]|nr:cytochrome c [Dehalococcoidia bacterium]